MASMDQSGHTRSMPPELALILLVVAFAVGMVLAWPWNWH